MAADHILNSHRIDEAILWITAAGRFLEAARVEGETLAQAEQRAVRRVWALVGHGIDHREAVLIETHIYQLAEDAK